MMNKLIWNTICKVRRSWCDLWDVSKRNVSTWKRRETDIKRFFSIIFFNVLIIRSKLPISFNAFSRTFGYLFSFAWYFRPDTLYQNDNLIIIRIVNEAPVWLQDYEMSVSEKMIIRSLNWNLELTFSRIMKDSCFRGNKCKALI